MPGSQVSDSGSSRFVAQAALDLATKVDTTCDQLEPSSLIREHRASLSTLVSAYAALGNVGPPVNPNVDIDWFHRSAENFRRIRAAGNSCNITSDILLKLGPLLNLSHSSIPV